MQNIQNIKDYYKADFIWRAELAIRDGETMNVVDEESGVRFRSLLYKGVYNGTARLFAVDNYGQIVLVSRRSAAYALVDRSASSLGCFNKSGQVESWDMDRGDLVIEGLVSSGRYVA